MKKTIEIGKTYKGKQTGILVVAESKEGEDGWFRGYLKDYPRSNKECIFMAQAFEPVCEFRYPTLFEVVAKYQAKGYSFDFDRREHYLFCFIENPEYRHNSLRRNVKYRHNETENELVRGILFVLSATDPEARKQYEQIKEFELKHKS